MRCRVGGVMSVVKYRRRHAGRSLGASARACASRQGLRLVKLLRRLRLDSTAAMTFKPRCRGFRVPVSGVVGVHSLAIYSAIRELPWQEISRGFCRTGRNSASSCPREETSRSAKLVSRTEMIECWGCTSKGVLQWAGSLEAGMHKEASRQAIGYGTNRGEQYEAAETEGCATSASIVASPHARERWDSAV